MKAGPGVLPSQASLLTMEGEGLLLSSVKAAEDGRDLILRFHETNGIQTKGCVIFLRQPAEAGLVDLQELPLDADVQVDGMTVLFECPPYGVRSLRVRFQG